MKSLELMLQQATPVLIPGAITVGNGMLGV